MCMAYIHPMSGQKYIQIVISSLVDDSYVTFIKWSYPSFTVNLEVNKGNNKITELRTILQTESQNS
jgi:hypothetical protein